MTTLDDVIRRPVVTEKSNYQSSKLQQYTFEVAPTANRTLVKDALETLYNVDVVSVNILNTAAKRSRRRNRQLKVRTAGFKKAIVTLAEGNTLPGEIFGGVK